MTSYGTQSKYADRPSSTRFASAEGQFGDFPYPPYSELPFSKRRRRHNNNKDFVKWAMRAVLASPIVVLCCWSIGAMLFANKHPSTSSTVQQKSRQQQMNMPSPQMTMAQSQPVQQQYMMMSQQQQQPLATAAQPQILMMMPPSEQQQQLPMQGQPMMMMANQQNPQQELQQQQQLPLGQAPEETVEQQVVETPVYTQKKGSKHSANQHRPAIHRPMPRSPQQQSVDQPQQAVDAPMQQQILYYDPKQAMANGRLEVPLTVYDQHGNPIPLQSLRGSRIFMEPPQQSLEQKQPSLKMASPQIQKWGESTQQDQSIIVATVAVMALLVGALSARRMRSRSFLSVCIENESLEDDVAYDTAYTTSQKDNSYYNTFASGGWKGDLEKFDV